MTGVGDGQERPVVAPGAAAKTAARLDGIEPAPKARTLWMIGNAHVDPVWLWRWPEGLQEVWATFRSALDRLEEYPEAVFSASSAAFYAWIERADPPMFEEVRRRVAEGRWAIVGGWWVEADGNLPSGESFVRQALYGQRFFDRAFGRIATVGWSPDGFGHAASLPQILRKSGLTSYVFMRPQAHEADLPALFRWLAPDGSAVLAARIVHEYASPTDDLTGYVDATLAKLGGGAWRDGLCLFGVGNHGGGPTKANLDGIRRLDGEPDRPRLRLASPEAYLARVGRLGEDLPVVRGELQHHARGCYAASSDVKRWTRSTEQLLLAAEKVSAIASWVAGQPYPADFEQAWRAVLFNQFHDILAGTSIEPAYEDARDGFGEARSIASRNLHLGLGAIARRIGIPCQPDAWPILAFNPHPWPVRTPVELEFRRVSPGDVLVDESDLAVPMQLGQSAATVNGSRTRPVFVAELPALGYRVFRLLTRSAAASALQPAAIDVVAGDSSAQTDRLRLEVEPETGLFRLIDRRTGAAMVSRGGRGVVLRDPGDTWSHGIERYDEPIGEFRPTAVRLVEQGPVRAVIRVESRFGESRLVQDLALYRDLDRLEVTLTLDWREPAAILKLRFTTPFVGPRATYEIPYGSLARPTDGAEEPGQSWLDVTGRLAVPDGVRASGVEAGVSLINDAKYAYDVLGPEIGLTVARSPIFAHHEPAVPDPAGTYSRLDQGIQRFRYVLLPHAGDWRTAGTARAAAELLQPPIALPETFHAGSLPQCQSFAEVDNPAVVVGVVKAAEDGRALVVRGVETAGEPAQATIALPLFGRWIDASFGPHEIKTFRVPREEQLPVVELDLLERPLER